MEDDLIPNLNEVRFIHGFALPSSPSLTNFVWRRGRGEEERKKIGLSYPIYRSSLAHDIKG
jgi:hypothetical protein